MTFVLTSNASVLEYNYIKMKYSEKELFIKSIKYRKNILKYIKQANTGHTGGSLSCVDILNVLYNVIMKVSPENFDHPDRDRYIQSKGHSVEALYVVLADKGFFPEIDLETLCKYDSHYVGHPTRKVNGVEQNTGALGHGLSIGVGTALAGKLDRRAYGVYVLLGDGELAEGSNWEAAMSAAHYKLDNLVAIIDYNTLQITGRTSVVCNSDPLNEKFEAFGWHVIEVDGHDVKALSRILDQPNRVSGKPTCIIAQTVKGKGISFMEDDKKWHHGVPDDTLYDQAIKELEESLIKVS
jgi:transketolase